MILDDLATSARHPAARAGFAACALGAVLLAAATAFWWPAQRARAVVEERIATERRALAQVRRAHELADAYARSAKEVAVLEKKLEYAATQAQLVQNLSQLARRHGVRILTETYDEGRGARTGLSAELAVQASYPALREFLREVAALPSWSELHEVRLETAQGSGVQKGRIRIVTYRKAPAEPAKAS